MAAGIVVVVVGGIVDVVVSYSDVYTYICIE